MSKDAKQALIESSVKIFSQEGYQHTRVIDIVHDAMSDIEAVNYYFQSKENLFIEALKYSFEIANTAYPIESVTTNDPEGAIIAYSEALLRRSIDAGAAGDFNRIMCNTVKTPDSPIERIMEEVGQLELQVLEEALRKLLPNHSELLLSLAKINVISLSTILFKYPFLTSDLIDCTHPETSIETFITHQKAAILALLSTLKL